MRGGRRSLFLTGMAWPNLVAAAPAEQIEIQTKFLMFGIFRRGIRPE